MRLALSLVAVALLAACSSPEDRGVASRNFDYVNDKINSAPIAAPEGLLTPRFYGDYAVPALDEAARNGYVGPKLDIRPPAQLMTIIAGSKVVANGAEPTLSFSVQTPGQDIQREVNDLLTLFLAKNKISIQSNDPLAGTIETGWFSNTVVLDGWGEEDEDYQLRQRYRFTLQSEMAGQLAKLSVKVIQHEENRDGEISTTMRPEDAERYATRLLNEFSLYMDEQQKRLQQAQLVNTLSLSMGVDSNDQPAWIATGGFDLVWARLVELLPQYGFELTSIDQSLGWIDVEYTRRPDSFWEERGVAPFPLAEDKYRFQLGELDDQTVAVTLYTEKKKSVDSATLSSMQSSFAKAFAK